MNNHVPPDILFIKFADHTQVYTFSEKDGCFVPLDESRLARHIPGYTRLNEKARRKEFVKFLKKAEIIREIDLSRPLPNAAPCRRRVTPEDEKAAIPAFLDIGRLFQEPMAGYRILADLLCAMHCGVLRAEEPSFRPAISIKSGAPEIGEILTAIVDTAVPKRRWHKKRAKLKRSAVLVYSTRIGSFPHHFQDFSQWKIRVKGYKPLKIPAAYEDTVLLIIGANGAQIREAAPYLENAAVILLNSDAGDLAPTKLPISSIADYDPTVIDQLWAHRELIASLLGFWWSLFDSEDEEAWARQIAQEARASFGKPDSRYIRVELDPKRLRDAIRYRVLLSFLDVLEGCELMTTEELASYRQNAKDVFDPTPPEPVVLRKAEDPEVFLEIMRELTNENVHSIVAENDRFVKADKPFAAWRTINGEQYLVLLEENWIRAYSKAARVKPNVDHSFFQQDNWALGLQKILVEHGYIKAASSGCRYRYDLLGNGTRDKTYVVAIPASFLNN